MNNSHYKKGLAVVLIIALILMTFIGIKLSSKDTDIIFTDFEEQQHNEIIDHDNQESTVIYVDIDGAVINPGVYKLKEGDRVNDAILMAGGLAENAYTKNLNKARILVDGEKIYILTEGESENNPYTEQSDLININTASINDLMSLPGIGEIYAKRIIEYRNDKQFSSIDEIKEIEGIGEKTFEKLKSLITID